MFARVTLSSRAFNFGLSAMGEAGVTKAQEIIQKEFNTGMGLCGLRSPAKITRDVILNPH